MLAWLHGADAWPKKSSRRETGAAATIINKSLMVNGT